MRPRGPTASIDVLGTIPNGCAVLAEIYPAKLGALSASAHVPMTSEARRHIEILMHYLLNHRADGFLDLQRRLARLEPARNAWRATFPDLDDDQLSRTLDVYVRSARYVVKSIPLAPWRGETEMRPLTDAEVHGLRAYLFAKAHLPNQPTKLVVAHAEIDEALRIDPSVLDALAVAFYAPEVRIDTPHPELARRAVSAHPESWLAWLMVADSTSSRDDPARLTALAHALEVAPDQPEVLTRIAALKASSGNWDEALAFSTKALRTGAVRPDLWMIRLAALPNTARCAEAASLGLSDHRVPRFHPGACRDQGVAGSSPCVHIAERALSPATRQRHSSGWTWARGEEVE